MLNRSFFDTLHLWPVVMWPIVFTSILYALFSFNTTLMKQGITYEALYKGIGQVFLIFYPVAAIFDTLVHFYLLYVIGWRYLVFIPSVATGSFIASLVFGFMPYAQYIMPIVYTIIVLSFLTLIGAIDISELAHWNVHIYRYLKTI
ncbi:MAG: hypothetical protein BGP07_11545 [Rhizobiales bacterium 63-22]|nr:MAG: hypothetical protein BGP07_11545 [Rhizobiales bacterium 63-22]